MCEYNVPLKSLWYRIEETIDGWVFDYIDSRSGAWSDTNAAYARSIIRTQRMTRIKELEGVLSGVPLLRAWRCSNKGNRTERKGALGG